MSKNEIQNIREKNNLNLNDNSKKNVANDIELGKKNVEDQIKELEIILQNNIEKNKNLQSTIKQNKTIKLQITNNINNTTEKLTKIHLLTNKIKNVFENNSGIEKELIELKEELDIIENQYNLKIEELNQCLKDIYEYLDKNN